MASYLLTRSLLNRVVKTKNVPSQTAATTVKLEIKLEPIQNVELMCRACAGSGCTPLQEGLGDGDIMSALCAVANMPISLDDKLPQYICGECLEQLESAIAFRRRCQETDRRLRSNVAPPVTHSTTYPYSKHDFKQLLNDMKLKRVRTQERKEKETRRCIKKEKTRRKKKERLVAVKFKCQPCNLSFETKDELSSHRSKRRCERHPCHVCGQLVLNLRQHVRITHAQVTAHTCHVCGKQFPIVARLRSHQRVHENTFNFHCDHCPYKSKHKYYLVLHMRGHTGEKPYACSLCPATFVNPSNLNKHRATHAEKLLPCRRCEKTFRTPTALKEHYNAAHMNIKHRCGQCGREFCYKSDLRKHEIRHHNRVKRDYVGGEATYKQVERLQREREQRAASTVDGVSILHSLAPGGRVVTQDAGVVTQDGRVVTQEVGVVTQDVDAVTQVGRVVTQDVAVVTHDGRVMVQNGGDLTQAGRVVTQNGVDLKQPGRVVTQDSEVTVGDVAQNGGQDGSEQTVTTWVQVQPTLMQLLMQPQRQPYCNTPGGELFIQPAMVPQPTPTLPVLPAPNMSDAASTNVGFFSFTHSNLN